MKVVLFVLALVLGAFPLSGKAGQPATDFESGTLAHALSFGGIRIQWKTFAFFVMPGQVSELELHLTDGQDVAVSASAGELTQIAPMRWQWRAPTQPGPQTLTVQPANAETSTLHVFVKVPAAQVSDGFLNGYRIGQYPDVPLRGNPVYLPPPGFVEVHPDMLDLPVSPHFTLGQFLCKQQPDDWPKYLVLREQLIAKLELILEEVNRRGIRTDSFAVMSGFRTPWYNRTIGNVPYSRHVWGGAADIYIDTNGDGRMDDLNKDGRVGIRDARVLLAIISDLYDTGPLKRLLGGLGLYGPRPHRGPFVHVDARGEMARWEAP